VTQFGMSEVIGLVAIGDSEHEVFLGRELVQRRQVSDHTARLVDQEVKRILDEAHDKARQVVEENQDLLERIAVALLERETLDRDQIETLERGDPLPPMPVPPALAPRSPEPAHRPVPAPPPPISLPGDDPLPGAAPGFTSVDED